MTNFDFLTADPQFYTFSSGAVSTEKILHIHSPGGGWQNEDLKELFDAEIL